MIGIKTCQFFFEIHGPDFSGPGELCHFEPQDKEIGNVKKFKPISVNPENFKPIPLILIENLHAQKGS